MTIYNGSCYCRAITYEVNLSSPDEARTSLGHCHNCKKFFGGAFGLTTKIAKSSFRITAGATKVHLGDNGSGTLLHREFCDVCGSGILEYGENAGDTIYIMYGTLEKRGELPPKGEFFCRYWEVWMPEIPGIFHKEETKS